MKTTLVLLFFIGLTFVSCKKESNTESNSTNDYTEITVNSQKIKKEHDPMKLVGWDNQSGCDALPYSKYIMEQFETSTFDFDVNIKHYRMNSDFSMSKPNTYGIVSDYDDGSLSCNLFLTVTFSDKIVGYDALQVGASNKITSITEYSSTSTDVYYTVKGEFSCSFMTNSDVLIPITGTYKQTIKTIK